MRILALPPSLLLSVVLQVRASAALDNDFSSYPQGSQQCLSDAADQSQCSGSTGQQLNQCLCSNQGNFIYNTAQCVAQKSPNDLETVYDTMENNCAGTGVTIAVSKDAFMSQARAATATSSSVTPSATSSATPSLTTTTSNPSSTNDSTNDDDDSNDSGNGSSSMATSTKIGLGVGVGFGAIALGLLAWFVWAYSRRRRNNNNNNQHLSSSSPSFPPSPYPPSTGVSGYNRDVELSHNYSTTNTAKSYAGWPSPLSPSSQQQGVMTAAEYAQHNGQFERAELDPGVGAGAGHEWKELPAEYYSGGEGGGTMMKHGDKRASDVPLLAELGAGGRTSPVELPADSVYDSRDDDSRARVSPASGQGHERGRRKGQGREDGDAG